MFFYHDLFHVKLNVKHANLTQSLEMDNRHGWRVRPREAIILASFLSSPNNSILGHRVKCCVYILIHRLEWHTCTSDNVITFPLVFMVWLKINMKRHSEAAVIKGQGLMFTGSWNRVSEGHMW